MKKQGVFLFLLLLFISCYENSVYNAFQNISLSGWEKNDTLVYEIPKLKNSGNYQLGVSLRINNNFPFQSLTLIVEQMVFPQHLQYTDTIKCNLIDNNGIAKGRGISFFQYDFEVAKRTFQKGDSVHINVRHDMKREIMPGVCNVGINIRKLTYK